MPSRHWQHHIDDMLTAIAEIKEFTAEISFEELQGDRKTLRAILYNFAILREAVRGIPDEVEVRHPEIPWLDLRGMRNIVIHEYFQLDLAIIWQTIQADLDPLAQSLRQILDTNNRGDRPMNP